MYPRPASARQARAQPWREHHGYVRRGPAILATAVALALVSASLAALIVRAVGARTFAPVWLWVGLVVPGMMAAASAVVRWRRYLAAERDGH